LLELFSVRLLRDRADGSAVGGGQQQQQGQQGGYQQQGQGGYGGQQESYGGQQGGYGGQQGGYEHQQGGYDQQQGGYGGQQGGYGDQQQGGYGQTGGAEFNRPHGQGGAGGYGGGMPQGESTFSDSGGSLRSSSRSSALIHLLYPHLFPLTLLLHDLRMITDLAVDQGAAIQAANAHAGNGNENASLFSTAFNHIGGMNSNDTNVDEDAVQQQHQAAYGQGQASSLPANAMGG